LFEQHPSVEEPPEHNIAYLYNFTIGFASFITICGYKTLQIMSQILTLKWTCLIWTSNEIAFLLCFLLAHQTKLGDGDCLPQQLVNATLAYLDRQATIGYCISIK
jgi:hypothetical protein